MVVSPRLPFPKSPPHICRGVCVFAHIRCVLRSSVVLSLLRLPCWRGVMYDHMADLQRYMGGNKQRPTEMALAIINCCCCCCCVTRVASSLIREDILRQKNARTACLQ